jgi:hypothetical protein
MARPLQQCTQIGSFPTAPKGEETKGLRHKGLDVSYFMRRCVGVFGKGTRTDPHGPRGSLACLISPKMLLLLLQWWTATKKQNFVAGLSFLDEMM